MLLRHPPCRAVPPRTVLVLAPVQRALARLVERVQLLAAKAVIAYGLHPALDAAFVLRAAHPRRVDLETASLRILEKCGCNARIDCIRRRNYRFRIMRLQYVEYASVEFPRRLASRDRFHRRLLLRRPDESIARNVRREDPRSHLATLALRIRREREHPAGIHLQLLARLAVEHRHRRR